MDKDAYIKHLEKENAELRKRIEVLEAEIKEIKQLLNINSQNSSKPPSSDGIISRYLTIINRLLTSTYKPE